MQLRHMRAAQERRQDCSDPFRKGVNSQGDAACKIWIVDSKRDDLKTFYKVIGKAQLGPAQVFFQKQD